MKRILFVAVASLSLMACKDEVTMPVFEPKVTTIVVTPSASQLEVGRTTTLTAVVKDQRDSVMAGKTVTWSSNNTPVATVAANVITAGATTAIVTAVTKGNATIIATVDGKTTSVPVFVVDPTVATVTITATVPPTFFVGQTLQATAVARDGANNPLTSFATTWTSSVPAVATVSSTGLITAVSAGTTVISATSGGKTGTLNVTVTLVPVARVSIALAGTAQIGRTVTVTPTLRSASNTTLPLTQRSLLWASSVDSIAEISDLGVITGLAAGTTIITCVVEGKVAVLNVTVTEVAINHLAVTPDSADVKVGETKQFFVRAFDADSVFLSPAAMNGRYVTWTTGDNTKAVVSNTGLVLGITPGETTVTATVGTKTKSAKVVIIP